MGRFVKAGVCLDCGAYLGVLAVCRVCGLSQFGPGADSLRGALTQADQVLDSIRQHSAPVTSLPSAPPTGPPPGMPSSTTAPPATPSGFAPPGFAPPGFAPPGIAPLSASYPTLPPADLAPRPSPISVSAVLLSLGAICFLVAAVVFVSVNWSDLSLAAKAAILLGVTLIIGAVALWSIRKNLRASAEIFSFLFAVLTALDFVAAREGGLAGIGNLSWPATQWLTGVLMLGVGGACAVVGSRSELASLRGVQGVSVLGVGTLVVLAFEDWPGPPEYAGFLALLALALVSRVASRLSLAVLAWGSGVVVAFTLLSCFALSFWHLLDSSTAHSLWVEGGVYGWLVCCAILAAAASTAVVPESVRIVTSAGAWVGVTAALLRPIEGAPFDTILLVTASVALLFAGSSVLVSGVWGRGARGATVVPVLAATAMLMPSIALALVKAVAPTDEPWTMAASAYPDTMGLTVDAHPVTVALVAAAVGAATCLAGSRRLPVPRVAVTLAGGALVLGVLGAQVPLWGVVAVLFALACGCGVVALRSQRDVAVGTGLAAGAAAVLTFTASLGSDWATACAALAMGVALVAVAVAVRHALHSALCTLVTVALVAVSVAAWVSVFGGDRVSSALGVVCTGAVAGLLAQWRTGSSPLLGRAGVEVGGLAAGCAGLTLTGTDSLALQIALTVFGGTAVLVSLIAADRRFMSMPGGALLAAASWVRLVDQDVRLVEAYTLPSAAVLVAVGGWRLRRRPELSSLVALAPGLSLALIPSLLRTLGEPTSARALILGVAALVVLLIGAGFRLLAPLVVGSSVVAVLALINIAPYAVALPRWVIFASVGAGLLFLGLTWEKRLRDVRAVGKTLERLR